MRNVSWYFTIIKQWNAENSVDDFSWLCLTLDDEGTLFLRNVWDYSPNSAPSQPRRRAFSDTTLWELQTSQMKCFLQSCSSRSVIWHAPLYYISRTAAIWLSTPLTPNYTANQFVALRETCVSWFTCADGREVHKEVCRLWNKVNSVSVLTHFVIYTFHCLKSTSVV